MKLMMNKTK